MNTYFKCGGGKSHGMCVWKKSLVETPKDLIEYVISDNSEEYPDSGEKDGFWYERIYGTVTINGEKYNGNIQITNLGMFNKDPEIESTNHTDKWGLNGILLPLDNKIYNIGTRSGGVNDVFRSFHIWDSTNGWVQQDDVPFNCLGAVGGVYKGYIWVAAGDQGLYRYNGSSWSYITTYPYTTPPSGTEIRATYANLIANGSYFFLLGGPCSYNGSSFNNGYTYRFNGSSWSTYGPNPMYFAADQATLYNNYIHMISSMDNYAHYKFNTSCTWTLVCTPPDKPGGYNGEGASTCDGNIYCIFGDNYDKIGIYNDSSGWKIIEYSGLDIPITDGTYPLHKLITLNNQLLLLASDYNIYKKVRNEPTLTIIKE